MQLKEAIALIAQEDFQASGESQIWADLGCGDGLFTQALADLLEPGSTIYAVDRTKPGPIPTHKGVNLEIRTLDFVKDDFTLPPLDGILMANSLHYVAEKPALIHKLKLLMKTDASFLVVEYDTDIPVPTWVPYPLSYQSMRKLFGQSGYKKIMPIGKRASVYGSASLYSVLIKK